MVIVPMFGRFSLLGLLVLGHEQPDYFSLEHMLLLQAIASQAAIATENARLFETMRQQQQRLNAVLHSAADAILIFDADKKVSLVNIAAQKLFGKRDIQVGQPWIALHENDVLPDLLAKADREKKSQACQIDLLDKGILDALVTPIEGGYVATLRDTSSRT